ncbi:MAG: hypothetical protein IKM22_00375 [Clostridia bacterium]|nr:hypothetical protein [Clostridia bacterium]
MKNRVHKHKFKLAFINFLKKIGIKGNPYAVGIDGFTGFVQRKLHIHQQQGIERLLLQK